MRSKKKLKLDALSSNELEDKEANQISGGIVICPCICICNAYFDKVYSRVDVKYFNQENVFEL